MSTQREPDHDLVYRITGNWWGDCPPPLTCTEDCSGDEVPTPRPAVWPTDPNEDKEEK